MSPEWRAPPEDLTSAACIRALELPGPLERSALASVADWHPAGRPERAAPARPDVESVFPFELPPPWWIAPDGPPSASGWSLWDRDRHGTARLWLSVDGFGVLRCAARWQENGLAWARLRLPDGQWMSLAPRAGEHPVWGVCDGVTAGGRLVARLPAQDWLALHEIPPLDEPGALPAGGGAALLNFVAGLMQARGLAAARYRGPYPTAHLFEALCRSFRWLPSPGEPTEAGAGLVAQRKRLLERFSADAWTAALRVAFPDWSHTDLAWQPDPFASGSPHPELWLHWRRGVDAVRLRGHLFERPAPGVPVSGGCRVWPDGGGWAAGILLLGQPWSTLARFDAGGMVVSYDPPAARPEPEPVPMGDAWRTALVDWVVVGAAPALASALAALAGDVRLGWSALPWSVAEPGPAPLAMGIQAGLEVQFRKLAGQGHPRPQLALMAVSDVMANAQPILRRWAQQRLAQTDRLPDPEALVSAGRAAQERARQRLAATLPELVARLARGEAWCEGRSVTGPGLDLRTYP